jgi:hypothetical protein
MKKILFGIGIFICSSVSLVTFAIDEPFPYDVQSNTQLLGQDETTDLSTLIKEDAVTPSDGILQTLSKFFRVSGTSYNPDNTGSPALNYVKWLLNMVLGLVSFIALVLVIFAFYLIFFSKDEEGIKKAKKILTGVAIALAIMGVSRLIVSYFFDIFTTVT